MSLVAARHGDLAENSDSRSSLLVVGCGNPFAGDDAVGLEIIRRLRDSAVAGIRLRELNQPPADFSALAGEDEVVLLIDAVVSGKPPGTIHLVPFPCPELQPRSLGALSTHGWGLQESLALSRALGHRLPRIVLLGIECSRVAAGAGLSPPVESAVDAILQRFAVLRRLVMCGDGRFPIRCFPSGSGEQMNLEEGCGSSVVLRSKSNFHSRDSASLERSRRGRAASKHLRSRPVS